MYFGILSGIRRRGGGNSFCLYMCCFALCTVFYVLRTLLKKQDGSSQGVYRCNKNVNSVCNFQWHETAQLKAHFLALKMILAFIWTLCCIKWLQWVTRTKCRVMASLLSPEWKYVFNSLGVKISIYLSWTPPASYKLPVAGCVHLCPSVFACWRDFKTVWNPIHHLDALLLKSSGER